MHSHCASSEQYPLGIWLLQRGRFVVSTSGMAAVACCDTADVIISEEVENDPRTKRSTQSAISMWNNRHCSLQSVDWVTSVIRTESIDELLDSVRRLSLIFSQWPRGCSLHEIHSILVRLVFSIIIVTTLNSHFKVWTRVSAHRPRDIPYLVPLQLNSWGDVYCRHLCQALNAVNSVAIEIHPWTVSTVKDYTCYNLKQVR